MNAMRQRCSPSSGPCPASHCPHLVVHRVHRAGHRGRGLGHDGVVRQLIQAGAPLDHVNNLHWTALIESIVLGDGGRRHVETLRALVEAGANTQLADRNGATPLALAKTRGYTAMVEILQKAGAR